MDIDVIIDYLNEMLELDRDAIDSLIRNSVPVNEAIAEHPTCTVYKQNGGYKLGMLGLLNGLIAKHTNYYLTMEFENSEGEMKKFLKFSKIPKSDVVFVDD